MGLGYAVQEDKLSCRISKLARLFWYLGQVLHSQAAPCFWIPQVLSCQDLEMFVEFMLASVKEGRGIGNTAMAATIKCLKDQTAAKGLRVPMISARGIWWYGTCQRKRPGKGMAFMLWAVRGSDPASAAALLEKAGICVDSQVLCHRYLHDVSKGKERNEQN